VDADVASLDGRRYAVARAPVQWNDPQGEWSLVLLGSLDAVMSVSERALIGLASGAAMLALGAMFLIWRRRLQHANAARAEAEAAQQAYTVKVYFDSEVKSFINDLTTELHQAETRADFARTFLTQVTMRVSAEYAVFYVLDRTTQLLTPIGGYGVTVGELAPVAVGEGLVGQCARDQAAIVIGDARETSLRIVWGGGAVAPSSVLLLPVMHANSPLGVVLFASLQAIDEEQRALLDSLMPAVAINLDMLEHHLSHQQPP
jgi:putative methionine-R-sulfoxide reductase with GAF domain